MNIAVVFYSLEGNTRYAAERAADRLEADLIELIPVNEYPKKGLAKFFHGGKSAVFGEKPELKPYEFEDGKYDKVILACPVWASKCAA
ncbi:MAG: flavodoxin family protein, partial [Clostridiales bacterium]|nr:flavodoxin family protein [Candidatus Blautia equi]